MSVDNRELNGEIEEPTLEDELEELTQEQLGARKMMGRITSANEVEQSRREALAIPLHPDFNLYSEELGYN